MFCSSLKVNDLGCLGVKRVLLGSSFHLGEPVSLRFHVVGIGGDSASLGSPMACDHINYGQSHTSRPTREKYNIKISSEKKNESHSEDPDT